MTQEGSHSDMMSVCGLDATVIPNNLIVVSLVVVLLHVYLYTKTRMIDPIPSLHQLSPNPPNPVPLP